MQEELKNFIQNEIQQLIMKKVSWDESLVESRLMNSISIIDLAVAIEEHTGISIEASDISVRNFDSINKICLFIAAKK